VLPGGVRGRVVGMTAGVAVRLVPAVQFPHWLCRRLVPTLGLDFGYGHWVELVQVAIFDDFG
jgi:hypothetical protein